MLHDRSKDQTTQTLGGNVIQLEHGRKPRQVLISPGVNNRIEMGGTDAQHQNEPPQPANGSHRFRQSGARLRVPTNDQEEEIRYVRRQLIGEGSFGTVYEAINADLGKVIAVKQIPRPRGGWPDRSWKKLKNEINALSRLKHPHVLNAHASRHQGGSDVLICMDREEGSVNDLINIGVFQMNIAPILLKQMLRALDCLANLSIIHRDVKPDNILYSVSPTGDYIFKLADFGLCTLDSKAITFCGARFFQAPEIVAWKCPPQSPKVDIWSLFVTLAYSVNVNNFREDHEPGPELIEAVLAAAQDPSFAGIKEMAVIDPNLRASAAQMLLRLYGGKGLSTPRDKVTPLEGNPATATLFLQDDTPTASQATEVDTEMDTSEAIETSTENTSD
ncbi:MAG: hypothetical protein M1837_004787 [Sclerophora amabilis]|nr:MAG: hypothetical protein M1837_004787 [Sclerophora amabilis]